MIYGNGFGANHLEIYEAIDGIKIMNGLKK
jgi:hypothetical protein